MCLTYVSIARDEDTDGRCDSEMEAIRKLDLKARKTEVDIFLGDAFGETTEDFEDDDGNWEENVRQQMLDTIEDFFDTIENPGRAHERHSL